MHSVSEGQFVRTSKGKVGYVLQAPYYSVGYQKGDEWEEIVKFSIDFEEDKIAEYADTERRLRNPLATYSIVNASIRLGKKDFAISTDKLLLIDYVTFTVGQESNGAFTLPSKDALQVLKIFDANNVWYHLS